MEKQLQVQKLLGDILTLMEFPARLDFKDAADGSLAVAMHFNGALPDGVAPGKKNGLVDSLQFLLNKCINRPNTERRWVLLGVGGFPEPRPGRVAPAAASPSAPPPTRARPAPAARPPLPPRAEQPRPAQRPARPPEVDEARLEVTADPALSEFGRALAERSARLGRSYAVGMMGLEDRARLLQAAAGSAGVTVRVEGESHFRRLVFTPDKPTAMPRRHAMAVYPDDEDEAD